VTREAEPSVTVRRDQGTTGKKNNKDYQEERKKRDHGAKDLSK